MISLSRRKLDGWESVFPLLTACIDVHQLLRHSPPNLEGILDKCQASFTH